MVGDWVSLFQGNPDLSSCNVQVSYIGEYGEVGIEGCEEYTSANCNLIFPIRLTLEILEKNGFKLAIEHKDIVIYESSDKRIKASNSECWKNTNKVWYIHIDTEDMRSMGYCEITYVHEFQHLLRLCGINKKIEI